MANQKSPPRIPIPQGWPRRVKSAMLHVLSLAQYGMAYTRSRAVNSPIARVRLKVENDRLNQHVVLLTEEIRIKNGRMERIAAHQRPHYAPIERLAILELRAARAWSLQQTADTFF